MKNQHGDFIWYELLTSDADASCDFYGKLIDWTNHPSSPAPGIDYRFLSGEDGSDDKEGVGRMAMAADPQGAAFGLVGAQT